MPDDYFHRAEMRWMSVEDATIEVPARWLAERGREIKAGGVAMSEFPLVCAFTVHGTPVAQGSKRVVPTRAGPRAIESNEAKLRPWRGQVSAQAALAMDGNAVETGAVQVRARFVFTRPKAHFGTGRNADTLKAHAPEYVASKPDVDKLQRALYDALTGIVFRDDSQIAHANCWKEYGPAARVDVEVRVLEAA